MNLTLLLLLAAAGALIIPSLGGDGDDDDTNQIRGTLDGEEIDGTDGNDNILAFDGDDTVNAGGGIDFVNAGLGNDTVNGGDGRDTIEGRAGDDTLNGGNGSDTIKGGMGNDRIDGGRQVDFIRGGRGDDIIFGGAPAELGSDGELVIDSTRGDMARGEGGDDTVFIWGGRGEAHGGEGEDTLVLVSGQGTLIDDFEDGSQTNYYAFANVQDENIPTRGIITNFDPALDTLTVTVDGVLDGAAAPDVEVTLEEQTITRGGETFSGVFVKAQIATGEPDVDGSEEAGVLITGVTIEELESADINAVFTDEADYFAPDQTLADVQELLAIP